MWLEAPIVETDDAGTNQDDSAHAGDAARRGDFSAVGEHLPALVREAVPPQRRSGDWAKAKLVRYADDFVVLARYQSRRLIEWIEWTLEGRFRLTINREKTRVVQLREPGEDLTFLGFTLRYDRDRFGRGTHYLNVFPSEKALARVRDTIRDLTGPQRCFVPIPELIGEVNRWLMSWSGTSATVTPGSSFRS